MFFNNKNKEDSHKSLPKHLKHFSYEKAWYESKKIFAYVFSTVSFFLLTANPTEDWKVVAVKAIFILFLFLVFAIAKTLKDVVVIIKQVDALIDSNKSPSSK